MNQKKFEEQLAELPLYAYYFAKSEDLVFSERIRYVCQTDCTMYGKSWACPPAVGTVEECKARCLRYSDAIVIATVTEVSDISDIEATLETRSDHEAVTRQVEAMLQSQVQEVYTLSTESCAICKHCTYPSGPCRHPGRMRPCIESHGIIITDLNEKNGLPFQYGDNVVTWFSLLLYNE